MRTAVILGVFLGGVVVGLAVTALQPQEPMAVSPFPELGAVPEPAAAAAIASALEGGDVTTLVADLTDEEVRALDRALILVPTIGEVRFAGAAAVGLDTVVGYVVLGADTQGPSISGFTVTVDAAGKVVSIR